LLQIHFPMKRQILWAVLYLTTNIHVLCQAKERKFDIGISTGYVASKTSDRLLNYYTYTGKAFFPINLEGMFLKHNNLCLINLNFSYLKAYPDHLNKTLYEYNEVKNIYAGLNLEFYKSIISINNIIRIFIGVANSSYVAMQEEDYKNLLYDFAKGYRKSYDLSIINLSPNLLLYCNFNKNSIRIKTGYTLVNLSSRPTDNYTKQLDLGNELHWNTYFPNQYKNFQFSVLYQFNFSKKIDVISEYKVFFHSYDTEAYKNFQNSFLIGISKKF
jgi:hypothetical protein